MEGMNNTLAKFQKLMTERNWSLYQLSKESGVSYNTLKNLYTRCHEPSLDTIRRLCACFNISLSEFFSDEPCKNPPIDFTNEEHNLILEYRGLNKKEKALLRTYIAGLSKKIPNPEDSE